MRAVERVLGAVVGERPGPTLVAVAGIHGNEPAGIEAGRRVLSRLDAAQLSGELLLLAGNRAALARRVRYQAKDLNRLWTEARIAEVSAIASPDAEDVEQRELLAELEAAAARARGPLHLADMHTSSAEGVPFAMFSDAPDQRGFVRDLRLPMIAGLDGLLAGVLSSHFARRGWSTFAVEGGQHEDPASVENLEAVLWQSLAAAGLVSPERDEHERSVELLEARRGELPRRLEVLSRHAITDEDRFVMEPGFRNIHRARAGQLLARDARGEIRAPRDGLVILPLYQGLGSDGYFWGREV